MKISLGTKELSLTGRGEAEAYLTVIASIFQLALKRFNNLGIVKSGGNLEFCIDESLSGDAFRLIMEENGAQVFGGRRRALAYGALEWLEEQNRREASKATWPREIESKPDCKFRACNQHAPSLLDSSQDRLGMTFSAMEQSLLFRANTFILAQNWPSHTNDAASYSLCPELAPFANPDWERPAYHYRESAERAAALDLDFFITMTEFHFPLQAIEKYPDWEGSRLVCGRELQPGKNVCPAHPLTRSYVHSKTIESCRLAPSAAGLELWLGEKLNSIFYCQCPLCKSTAAPERVLMLVEWVYGAMKEILPKGRLILRTYLCAGRCWHEPGIFSQIKDKFPEDVIIGLIGQYGDFNYLNDPNPLIGMFPRDTIVEFDIGGEYRGTLHGYFSGVGRYLEERMELYRMNGASGFAIRHIDWLGDASVSEAFAFYAKQWDFERSLPGESALFLENRFGHEAGAGLSALLGIGEEIVRKGLHILGLNAFGCFGFLPDTLERTRYNALDHCARMATGGVGRFFKAVSDPSVALDEKDEALRLCEEFRIIVENLKPILPDKLFKALSCSAEIMKACTAVHRICTELFLRKTRYERAVHIDERLWEVHAMRKLACDLLAWYRENLEVAGEIDLEKLYEAHGMDIFLPVGFDAGKRLPMENVKALSDKTLREIDPIYDFFDWNIIL
ncbi:MAG: hypothetical protein LBU32_15295 [Clostridiales bacterium]|jgi:hypothetical protein|nr:hypothetical protein [Clostridiales bacterium]